MAFRALKLSENILRALQDEGYETPTPIQQKAIPPILEGKDVLGCAQTGTGKTAAFALPIIQRLTQMPVDKTKRGPAHPRALILAPTRELAAQIGESFGTYGRHEGLSHTVIFGGVSQYHQVKAIHRGVDVLVATPGRLLDLMEQRIVTLKDVKVFVLDEADRMLDMGFIQPIRQIASQVPKPRQTLLFSATMPKEIMHLADSLLRDPVKVSVTPVSSAVPLIEQRLYMVPMRMKMPLLERLLDEPGVERAIVFTKTKHGADRVCKHLNHDGVPAVAIHGNKAQNYRTRALDGFRSGKTRVLVATDVAARGLDVDDITHVFNFDLPMEPEAYVHRIGRTGRAGATGIAISFCDPHERDLLRAVQRLTRKDIPVFETPTDLPMSDHAMARSHEDRRAFQPRGRQDRGGPPRHERPRHGSSDRPAFGHREPREHRTEHASAPSHTPRPSHASRPAHAPRSDHAARPIHALRSEQAPPTPRPHHAPRASDAPRSPHAPGAPSARPMYGAPQKKQHRKGPNTPHAKTTTGGGGGGHPPRAHSSPQGGHGGGGGGGRPGGGHRGVSGPSHMGGGKRPQFGQNRGRRPSR